MLQEIKQVIRQAEKSAKESLKSVLIHDVLLESIENLFYANLINNFKDNLTIDNLKEFNISEEEKGKIKNDFEDLFESVGTALEESKGINEKDYISFKDKLNKASKGGYKLLLEIEKTMEFKLCRKEIDNFKKTIKILGKKVEVNALENEKKVGLSIKYK